MQQPHMSFTADPTGAGSVAPMTVQECMAAPALATALIAYGPHAIRTQLQALGLTAHQEGPGLASCVAAQVTQPSKRGRTVLHTLSLLLDPESLPGLCPVFVPTAPPGISQRVAKSAFRKEFGCDAAALSVQSIASSLHTHGVLLAAAAVTHPGSPTANSPTANSATGSSSSTPPQPNKAANNSTHGAGADNSPTCNSATDTSSSPPPQPNKPTNNSVITTTHGLGAEVARAPTSNESTLTQQPVVAHAPCPELQAKQQLRMRIAESALALLTNAVQHSVTSPRACYEPELAHFFGTEPLLAASVPAAIASLAHVSTGCALQAVAALCKLCQSPVLQC